MSFDFETARYLTDFYQFLLGLGVLLLLMVILVAVVDRGAWPLTLAMGGLTFLWAVLLVPQLFTQESISPEPFPFVEYGVSPETVSETIEGRFDVTVVDVPEDVGSLDRFSVRVASGDRLIECFAELVGEATVDGQGAVLRCDGGDLPTGGPGE